MAPSPMVRRKSLETKTKTRLRKRNSQSRQRSTRNQRWSQWKTSSPSAADLEPTPCKAYWAAQLFLKFCATSFDDSGGHVQPGASQKRSSTPRSSELVYNKVNHGSFNFRSEERRVGKECR